MDKNCNEKPTINIKKKKKFILTNKYVIITSI